MSSMCICFLHLQASSEKAATCAATTLEAPHHKVWCFIWFEFILGFPNYESMFATILNRWWILEWTEAKDENILGLGLNMNPDHEYVEAEF